MKLFFLTLTLVMAPLSFASYHGEITIIIVVVVVILLIIQAEDMAGAMP